MNIMLQTQFEEVKQNLHKITFPDSKILYLIGTAHVSKESIDLVEETISKYNPDTISIELDEQRYKAIMNPKNYDNINIFEIIKKKQLFFFIGQFIMSSFQKKISEKTGSKPGAEFKKAAEIALEQEKKIVLADRNIGITLKRAWRLTPFSHKMKFLGSLFFSDSDEIDNLDIESLKGSDAIESMMEGFADELPITKKVLIDERDSFLASKTQNDLGDITVAVVGAGHVPGMLKRFSGELEIEDEESINFIPKSSKITKIIPWLIPAIVIGGFIYGFLQGDAAMTTDVILYWILANGVLTAIGCAIAFGHPLTIVAGFIAAPLTSLNPTIGAGFVTAFVQAMLSKPRISDFAQIQENSLKIKQWWTNRVTRIFLVFILSSIGSSIGTFVALPALRKLFG